MQVEQAILRGFLARNGILVNGILVFAIFEALNIDRWLWSWHI